MTFATYVIWFMIGSVYAVKSPHLDQQDCNRLALGRVKTRLWKHYRERRASEPGWKKRGNELWNLTESMISKNKKKAMTMIKASEARSLIAFVLEVLEESVPSMPDESQDRIRGEYLLAAARSAREVDRLLSNNGRVGQPLAEQQTLMNHYVRHVTMFVRAGAELVPKHHQMIHLIQQGRKLGAPHLRSTYVDESLNGVIARIAQSAHRWSFSEVTHYKYAGLQAMTGLRGQHMT